MVVDFPFIYHVNKHLHVKVNSWTFRPLNLPNNLFCSRFDCMYSKMYMHTGREIYLLFNSVRQLHRLVKMDVNEDRGRRSFYFRRKQGQDKNTGSTFACGEFCHEINKLICKESLFSFSRRCHASACLWNVQYNHASIGRVSDLQIK